VVLEVADSNHGLIVLVITPEQAQIYRLMSLSALQVKAMLDREKAIGLSNLNQMTAAFQLYSMDFDDFFPPGGSGWKDSIYPYVKNRSLMEGMNYTPPGNLKTGDPSAGFPIATQTYRVVRRSSTATGTSAGILFHRLVLL